ncbi:MAG: peroxidase [Pseudomonadota bacterium]
MTKQLNLDDIQGNVIRAYGKFGYPKARYFFLNLTNAWVGRRFTSLVIDKITTARRWPKDEASGERKGPDITMNIGYTFMGLYMMELPTRTLQSMPDEFIDGMRKRAFILGDKPADAIDRPPQPVMASDPKEFFFGEIIKQHGALTDEQKASITASMAEDDPYPEWMKNWDPIWKENRSGIGSTDVHIWVSMNAKVIPGTEEPVKAPGAGPDDPNLLDERTQWLLDTCRQVSVEYAMLHKDPTDKTGERFDPRGVIRVLPLNGEPDGPLYQSASAVFDDITLTEDWTAPDGTVLVPKGTPVRLPTPFEHFEMSDGIGDPVFEGQFEDADMDKKKKGRGKWMSPDREWEPLATGEFLLGHPDESQELPPAARPPEFSMNGTFMAFRKLHENVESFFDYIAKRAKEYVEVKKRSGVELTLEDAGIELRSKMVGRWPDGVSLTQAGDFETWKKVRKHHGLNDEKDFDSWKRRVDYLKSEHASDFKFAHDMQGYDNPNSSHLRRMNTRDYLDPLNKLHPETYVDPKTDRPNPRVNKDAKTQLNKRRRIMRRGLPYGDSRLYGKSIEEAKAKKKDPVTGKPLEKKSDKTEQGVAMMIICANLFRQFEFVQQQWVQYGLDFNSGNNTCPLIGDHEKHSRYTIPADPAKGGCPFVMSEMPTFVEPRGGEYFFIPSMTALRMIADGTVDPT